MKSLLIMILLLMGLEALAQEVRVEISPPRPVAGEQFQARFSIISDSGEEPAINFVPTGVEVLGKTHQGASIRSTYMNGKLTVMRQYLVVYDLSAPRAGTAYLRDINVQVGGATMKHPTITLSVLKEAEEPEDVFVAADVPKTELFVGEGIIVRYYLYSKTAVNSLDIKKYPKLNHFLKRFLQEPDRTERVQTRGGIYMRSQIYAAKLFPEKTGELKVDPLSLSATYPVIRGNDPFGSFGLSRDFRTRTFSSEPVAVIVRELPAPVPPDFTGLVGKHEFNLNLNQQKLLVGEPLEIKLAVSGPGALENLNPPTLVNHQGLEEFESTGDLKIADADSATKTFEYTYLARENLQLPASGVSLSYLDPNSGRYVSTNLSLPEIVVAGGQAPGPKATPDENKKKEIRPAALASKVPEVLKGPVLDPDYPWAGLLPYFNLGLAGVALLLGGAWVLKSRPFPKFHGTAKVPSQFRRGEFEFGDLTRWMTPLIRKTGKAPGQIIRESELDDEAKSYFEKLFSSLERNYAHRGEGGKHAYDSKHFRSLARVIERAQNEDHPESA